MIVIVCDRVPWKADETDFYPSLVIIAIKLHSLSMSHKCLFKEVCVPVSCMVAIEYISLMYMGIRRCRYTAPLKLRKTNRRAQTKFHCRCYPWVGQENMKIENI